LDDPSADIGVWLDRLHPEKKYDPRNSDCRVQKVTPDGGKAGLLATPTTIRWSIYNFCPDDQVVRIDYLGPKSPFLSCDNQDVQTHTRFKVPPTKKDATVTAECKLVQDPCNKFFIDVNKFPDHTNERATDRCPIGSGQIEIEPW